MAQVNVSNTLVLSAAQRGSPYYDDFDEAKNFYKILFRPGYAVQARELSQIQTLSQVQTERLGRHIFKNGSIVYGGQISFDRATSINLESQYVGTDVDVNDFIGKKIIYGSGNTSVMAEVLAGENAIGNEPPTLMIKYLSGTEFSNSSTIRVQNENVYANINTSASYQTTGLTSTINDGVFFINGYFVRNGRQTIVLSKYDITPNAKVGLEFSDDIITETSDTSLFDPAQEASNYQAPGAARYKIDLNLSKRSLTSVDDEKFIELLRIENGERRKQIMIPIYSELEETFARRTYDESGSYTVRPFKISISDDTSNTANLLVTLDPGKAYVFGYEFETISPTTLVVPRPRDTSNVTGYDIATSYGNYVIVGDVRGFFDHSTMSIVDMHSVPVASSNNANAATYNQTKIGTTRIRNLIYNDAANTANGYLHTYRAYLFDSKFTSLTSNAISATGNSVILFDNSAKFSLLNTAYDNVTVRVLSGTGEGQIRTVASYDGQSKNLRLSQAWSTPPTVTSNISLQFAAKDMESLIIATPGGAYTANANINVASKLGLVSNGDVTVAESLYQSLVFRVPNAFLKDKTGFNNYQYRGYLGGQTFTAGSTGPISAPTGQAYIGTGTLSDTIKRNNYLVIPKTIIGGSNVVLGVPLSFDTSLGRSIVVSGSTVQFNANLPGDSFTADIVSDLEINTGTGIIPKKKTLVTANTTHTTTSSSNGSFISGTSNATVYLISGQVHVQNPNKTPGVAEPLYISDAKELKAVYNLNGATITPNMVLSSYPDVKSNYYFFDGQRDTFYDHAELRLKPGVPAPKGPLVVCLDYYDHGAFGGGPSDGFFTLESYPNVTTTAGYRDIPTYTTESGEVLRLADVIDFRPRRQNASNTSPGYTLQGIRIPSPNEDFTLNYDYYLPRRDLIALSRDRNFNYMQGTSAELPYPPNDPDDGMVLYRMTLPAYVLYPSNVIVNYVENKRYTMRDIGKLETRIQNLEYYTTLSFLEKDASDVVIRDSNGFERTKFGIVADDFIGHQIGDVTNEDYKCSMDFAEGELRAPFNATNHDLKYRGGDANHRRTGNFVTMNYSEGDFVVQNNATKAENVQPYLIARFIGTMELSPDGDIWVNTDRRPDVISNLNGTNDAWERTPTANTAFNTEWNFWSNRLRGNRTTNRRENSRLRNDRSITTIGATSTTTTTDVRTSIDARRTSDAIMQNQGDRVVDVSIVPYIRSREVFFFSENLRPNRQVWFFCDDKPVLDYVQRPNIIRLTNTNRFDDRIGINERIVSGANSASVLWCRPDPTDNTKTLVYVANVTGVIASGQTYTGAFSGNTGVVNTYVSYAGTAAGGNTTVMTLQVGSSSVADFYTGNTIHIVAGSGIGQNSTIQSYNATTRNVTVSPAFTVAPTTNTRYSIGNHFTTSDGGYVGAFHIPSNDNLAFRTGDRVFRILDQRNNDLDNATTRADAKYNGQGLNQSKDATIISTTPPRVVIREVTQTLTRAQERRIERGHDPLAQTFFVPEDLHPNGIFISSVDLFFRTKSATMPVWVEIRPTVNGFPSAKDVVPYSRKTLYPNQVNVSENPSASNAATKTTFTFDNPVYLPPGEHALVVLTDSLDYEAFVSELGKPRIGSNRIVSDQPYLGSLFKSQNASAWTPFQLEDLMMVIKKCDFTTGEARVYLDTVATTSNTAMDWMHVITNALVFANTELNYAYRVTDAALGTIDATYTNFITDEDYRLTNRKMITTSDGSANVRAILSTQDRDISPILDVSQYSVIAIENLINNANLSNSLITISGDGLGYQNAAQVSVTISGGTIGTSANAYVSNVSGGNVVSILVDNLGSYYVDRPTITISRDSVATVNATANIASELDAFGGPLRAKYITRKVRLRDEFEAGDLRVYITAYRPVGTEIVVYYKVMNNQDPDKFENKGYARMVLATTGNRRSANESDYIEYEFRPSLSSNTISYTSGSTTFRSFQQYAIKIGMLADNPAIIPIIKDMRAMALPGGS